MTLTSRIEKDYIKAYKAKDTVKVAVLRHLKTAIKNRMIDVRGELSDEDVADIIAKQVKQRRDSYDQYVKAGRTDLADIEAAEMVELEEYMPKQLTNEELEQAVSDAIKQVEASGMKDMGKVMKALSGLYKGRFDGGKASALVKTHLLS